MILETSLVLDRLVPLGLVLLALSGAYRGQTVAAILAAALLVVLMTSRFWARHSLDAVEYERTLSDDRAFPGDEIELTLRVENRKLLPVTWIEISDEVPSSLHLADRPTRPNGSLTHVTSVSWHEAVSWKHTLQCDRRGVYVLGPATLASGDPFGLFPVNRTCEGKSALVVYPRFVPVDVFLVSPNLPQGGRRPERWIFEDASRTVGAREYRRGDALRRIHWKATARRQALQTRVYEPTTDMEIVIFIALGTFPGLSPEIATDPFELGISTAASLGRHFCEHSYPVGLYANGGGTDGVGALELAPGSSSGQLIYLLEALARLTSNVAVSPGTHLSDTVPRLPWGASVIVVAGDVTPELDGAVRMLRGAGRRIEVAAVCQTGSTDASTEQPVDVV